MPAVPTVPAVAFVPPAPGVPDAPPPHDPAHKPAAATHAEKSRPALVI